MATVFARCPLGSVGGKKSPAISPSSSFDALPSSLDYDG
jgi:hypothetical protein